MNYTEFLPVRKFITKEWFRQAVAKARVSGEYLAHQMGISHSLFSRMINPADPDRHMHFHQGIRYLGEEAIRALCTLMEAVA